MGTSKDGGPPLSIKAFIVLALAASVWLLVDAPDALGVGGFILQIVFLVSLYRGDFWAWVLFVLAALVGIPLVFIMGQGLLAAASGAIGLALLLTPASIRWCRPSKALPRQPSMY